MISKLPLEPPEGFTRAIRGQLESELEGYPTIFSSCLAEGYLTLDDVYSGGRPRKQWVSQCTCSCCSETYLTGKVTGKDAIRLLYGDDGSPYTTIGYAGDDTMEVADGDDFLCPICGCETRLLSAKRLRGGKTKAIQVCQLTVIDRHAVVLYWRVDRTLYPTGRISTTIYPMDAFVLMPNGRLRHYKTKPSDGGLVWYTISNTKEPFDRIYHDWGSINNRKCGSIVHPTIPSLVGTTGEKTGLHSYWSQAGGYPVDYLKLWKAYPAIENLVTAGAGMLVCQLVAKQTEQRYLDLSKRKPHQLLRMTREEFRSLDKAKLNTAFLDELSRHRELGFCDSADLLQELLLRSSFQTLFKLQEQSHITGEPNLKRVLRYLSKQGCLPSEVQLLEDARTFAKRLNHNAPLTPQELWPPHLRDAHDRLAQQVAILDAENKKSNYQRGFDSVLANFSPLQWSDGDLCILLPKSGKELIAEGKTLNHCVGGYVRSHSEGERIIFFVRNYRRPERSYYTLNISMGIEPSEIQLHGYGNETHRDKKGSLHHHSIPAKVRAFCDRWEQEILTPFCQAYFA